MVKYRITKTLLAGAALGALCSPAYAQDSDGADENVIIVTANKREQNLQEIPVAISALSSETIELQGITQTQDLSGLAPNVAVNGGTTNATASV
ncbi:MAG: TonB-dependent receptor, partial [Parasphingorhabdus sp.]